MVCYRVSRPEPWLSGLYVATMPPISYAIGSIAPERWKKDLELVPGCVSTRAGWSYKHRSVLGELWFLVRGNCIVRRKLGVLGHEGTQKGQLAPLLTTDSAGLVSGEVLLAD